MTVDPGLGPVQGPVMGRTPSSRPR
jgi:hypothetical protein